MAKIYNSVNQPPEQSNLLQRNIYTTEQVEYRLRQKADKTNVYTKLEVDSRLNSLSSSITNAENSFLSFTSNLSNYLDVPLKWNGTALVSSLSAITSGIVSPIPVGWSSNLKTLISIYPNKDTGDLTSLADPGVFLGRQTIIRGGNFNNEPISQQENPDMAMDGLSKYIYPDSSSSAVWKQFEPNNRLINKHSVSSNNNSLGANSLYTGELAININTGDIFVGWEGKSLDLLSDIPLDGVKRLFSPNSYVRTTPVSEQIIQANSASNITSLVIKGGNVILPSEDVRADILQIKTKDDDKRVYVDRLGNLNVKTLNTLDYLTVPVSSSPEGQNVGIRYNPVKDIFEGYVDGWSPLLRSNEYVTLDTVQTITATKYFSQPIYVQEPTEGSNPATKNYVDTLSVLNIPGTGYLKKNNEGVWYLDRKIGFLNRVFYVSKDGNDNNDGTSIETSKLTIKAALELTDNSVIFNKALDAAKIIEANKNFLQDEVFGYIIRTYPELNYSSKVNPTGVLAGRFRDGSDLIKANRAYIIDMAYAQMMGQFPGFVNPDEQKCRRDIGYIVDAIVKDLYTGGNSYIVQATQAYFTNGSLSQNGLLGEESQSVYAFTQVGELCKSAINNQLPTQNLNLVPDPVTGSNTDPDSCANVKTAIDNLISIINTAIQNNSLSLLPEVNYGPWSYYFDSSLCKRDLGYIIDAITSDLRAGGNINCIETAEAYYSGNNVIYIANELSQTMDAINKLRDLCILAIRNWQINSNGDLYQPQYSLQTYTILEGIAQESYPQCNDIASIIQIYAQVINTILDDGPGSVQDIPPYTGSTIYVKNGVYKENNPLLVPPEVSVIGDNLRDVTIIPLNKTQDIFWVNNGSYIKDMSFKGHKYPAAAVAFPSSGAGTIFKSPYIQNCTSFGTTGTGMRVDGNKAQGLRSMVLDSYTQYNQGGIGVEVINKGYAQLVSMFTICCDKAVYATGGGTCSITNSNTDFGNYGLVADGVSPLQYSAKINGNQSSVNTFTIKNLINRPYIGQVITVNGLTYFVQKINVTNPGSGYTVPPKVTISSPTGINGIPAKASAILKNGQVSSIILVSSGRQYTGIPSITIEAPQNGVRAEAEAVIYPVYYTILEASELIDGECTIKIEENLPFRPQGDQQVDFYQVSKIIASSHCFEYVGSGTNISKARPEVGGTPIPENEVVKLNGGRVAVTSTDQSGNFKIGSDLTLNQNIGTLTGRTFTKSLFVSITPLILALEG